MRSYREKIEGLGWSQFCQQPGEAILPVVRDFYNSGSTFKKQRKTVKVRDVRVSFGPDEIRRVLGLQAPEVNEYAKLLESPPWDDILCVLAKPGSAWTISAKGEPLSIPGKCLICEPRVWFRFVSARLIPGTNLVRMTKDRATLIYCIMTGKQIDVGSLIFEYMLRGLSNPHCGLWFPSLVFELCVKAGVKWLPTEERTYPQGAIDYTTVFKMEREVCGGIPLAATPGTSYSSPPPELPPQDATPAGAGPSKALGPDEALFAQQWAKVEAFMSSQEKKLQAMEQMLVNLDKMVHKLLANEGLDESLQGAADDEPQEDADDVENEDAAPEEDTPAVEQTRDYAGEVDIRKEKPKEAAVAAEDHAEHSAEEEAAADAQAAEEFATEVLLKVAQQVQQEAKEAAGSPTSSEADGLGAEEDDVPIDQVPVVVLTPPSQRPSGRSTRLSRRSTPTEMAVEEPEIVIQHPVAATPKAPPQVKVSASVQTPPIPPVRAGREANVPAGSDDEDNITLAAKKMILRRKTTAGRRQTRTSTLKSPGGITISDSPAAASGTVTKKRKQSPARRGKVITPTKAKVSKRPRVSAKGKSSTPAVQSDLEKLLDQLAKDEKAGVKYSDDEEDKDVTESDEPADEQFADSDASD